ncbi:hypothetical protein [Klebsiella pneumoniae IS43]|uniref:Uncharacterized protein n=1 Tax=Klebsiella pneumoniae IS43 TaxID=1432552 RepID=W1DGE6_KLEPN|nr:hypothetical protein [Klebsiella pneumoniae IS43]
MAVEIKYVVIREGEEKNVFCQQKRGRRLRQKCSIWQRC